MINMLPLWAMFVLTWGICIGAAEAGSALARAALRKKNDKDPEAPLGSLVGAMLGLLAFILAFTFGVTASRLEARKQLVLDESNAIGTTYLRAGLLPQTQGLEVRRLLREYVEVRLTVTPENVQEALNKSEEIHGRLWSQTKSLVQEEMDSEVRSLFITSLNELIDLHQSRLTVGVEYRLPESVWLAVYLLSALSMLAVGYQVGMSGVRRMQGTTVLGVAFSLVIVMIADIDRPGEGLIQVSQQPIADVQRMMLRDSP
ncbi:MAG: hypothetical protein IAF94_03695 [Pirellulaceae bacterium]|nr:hypothetical protein [Pirellulaceae bacterium]